MLKRSIGAPFAPVTTDLSTERRSQRPFLPDLRKRVSVRTMRKLKGMRLGRPPYGPLAGRQLAVDDAD